MMKKAFILFLVLVLSVGIFAVPTGAEHETDPNATPHSDQEIGYKDMTEAMRDYIDQHKADLDERERLLQELNNYAKEIHKQSDVQMGKLLCDDIDDQLLSALLDNLWELCNIGKISKDDYWVLANAFTTIKDGGIATKYPKWLMNIEKRLYDDTWNISEEMWLPPEVAALMLFNESLAGFPKTKWLYKYVRTDDEGNFIVTDSDMQYIISAVLDDATYYLDIDFDGYDYYEFERWDATTDGGREFADELLDDRINKMYKVMYPFGIAIMLVCWMIGMTRSGLNATFDIKDKDSIARSMIDLVIGIGLLALAPWIIETMTSLGFEMCDRIGVAWRPEIYEKNDDGAVRWVIDALGIDTVKDKLLLALIKGTLVMNIMRIGLMQCLAPLSIGCIAGGDRTKNMAFGWLKEYLKLCLLPAVTAIYICLACAATHTIDSMWINIIIGLSYFVVPKMMLDKLFG